MSSTKTLVLYQPQDGYCYNSDTHFLYNFIVTVFKKYKNIQGDLLDIGSGSGILGLLLKRDYPKFNLHQCEIQELFQFLSQKNSSINQLFATLYKGDFQDICFEKKFDYIVSNPPFYHSNVVKSENENLQIARYSDSLPLESFFQKVSHILSPKGKLFFCYDAKQLDNIILLAQKFKINIETLQFLHPNQKKEASLVMVYAQKNSQSPLRIFPPLVMFNEEGKFYQHIEAIYQQCNTYSIKCKVMI